LSRPARARGLKHLNPLDHFIKRVVAPRAGAWIETTTVVENQINLYVAPRAGAWIET